MEKKINIAEILKDCPNDMQLDCVMFDNVTFVRVDNNREQFPIEIAVGGLRSKYLTKEGCFHDTTLLPEAKCVIFPKGKTTWEGFVPPVQFKEGDIVAYDSELGVELFIFKEFIGNATAVCYLYLNSHSELHIEKTPYLINRLATEEEKKKLFDAIKDNGYKWNAETKTLEKFPKFKVGDRIRNKTTNRNCIITHKDNLSYYVDSSHFSIWIKEQDEWELVPNKFDVTTLNPFESKVLIRDYNGRFWMPSFWGKHLKEDSNCRYLTTNGYYRYCIPYEGNEHLLGTNKDCDDYYKTWEE